MMSFRKHIFPHLNFATLEVYRVIFLFKVNPQQLSQSPSLDFDPAILKSLIYFL